MKSLSILVILFPVLVLAQAAPTSTSTMDWGYVLEFVKGLSPWALNALTIIGSLVVIGTGIDAMVDDKVDHGFMKKVMAIPMLGSLLEAVKKFSPFNYRG